MGRRSLCTLTPYSVPEGTPLPSCLQESLSGFSLLVSPMTMKICFQSVPFSNKIRKVLLEFLLVSIQNFVISWLIPLNITCPLSGLLTIKGALFHCRL